MIFFASLLSPPAVCFEIMGFLFVSFFKMVLRSPGMILLGKYPLFFLPDIIGVPGSKNDVLPSVSSDHRVFVCVFSLL